MSEEVDVRDGAVGGGADYGVTVRSFEVSLYHLIVLSVANKQMEIHCHTKCKI